MPLLISKLKNILCYKCNRYGTVETDILEDALPVSILCNNCGEVIDIISSNDVLQFGKVDPISFKKNGGWLIYDKSKENENREEIDNINITDCSFNQRADMLLDLISKAQGIGKSIISDVEKLSRKLESDIGEYWSIATDYSVHVGPSYYASFLKCPFSFIDTNNLEDGMTPYSKWCILPVFFKRTIGFPLGVFGGHRIGIVLPYSTLSFPLEKWESNIAKIKDPPMLEVFGRKIIGDSISDTWFEIPGVTPDDDHTEYLPSIKISDPVKACKWLACHGVLPYTKMPLGNRDIMQVKTSLNDILSRRLYISAFEQLCRNGRLILAWKNRGKQMNFLSLVFSVVRGTKVFITKNDQEAEQFSSFNSEAFLNNLPSTDGKRHVSLSESYTKFRITDELNQFSMIAVDFSDDKAVPDEFIEFMYGYNGRLIIFASDPIMDAMQDNYAAGLCYGLCGISSIDESDLPSTRFNFKTAFGETVSRLK